MTLRAVSVTSRRRGYDSDDDYTASRNARQPINRQADQANNPAAVGAPPTNRQIRNDAWSTRMREKVMSLTVVIILVSLMVSWLHRSLGGSLTGSHFFC
jgi:hypothetical protein